MTGDGGAEGMLPVSYAQQRLWFLDQWQSGTAYYNSGAAWRLRGQLDRATLEAALLEVTRRHEVLRTVIATVNGSPMQVVQGPPERLLDVVDLDSACPEEDVRRWAGAEMARPFNLSRAPLLRARLLRLHDEDHVLVLAMHHIIVDAWSLGVLGRELSAVYTAAVEGRTADLPQLAVQYGDYAIWQREWLQGDVLAEHMAYWGDRLRGAPPILALPTDRPRPAVASHRGALHEFRVPRETGERLRQLGRQRNCTLFMTLLAGLSVLLGRYAGEDDVVVGTPVAGRPRRELEDLIGFFVNTLVMRTDLSDDPRFLDLLDRVREGALEAYDHQDLPFEKLVEEVQPERDVSRQALFQVMFQVLPAEHSVLHLPGLTVEDISAHPGTSKFDLAMSVVDRGGELVGAVEYSTDLFDAQTIARLVKHFSILLTAIVEEPARRISEYPLVDVTERRQVLDNWNGSEVEVPQRCLHELFAEQVACDPEATAVVYRGQRLTYAELEKQANRLAHHLRALHIGPETPVGLCLKRSLAMVVGVLGILKAGGAYVPLDPAYPAERLGFMLEDTAAPVLVTEESLLAELPQYAGRVVCIDRDAAVIGAQPDVPPYTGVGVENLAYVIYTSGSTGKPKGVMVEHRNVVNMAMAHRLAMYSGQRTPLQATLNASLSFDASLSELALLLDGHCIHIVPDLVRHDVHGFQQFLEEGGIEVFNCTPSQFRALYPDLGSGQARVPARVILGGEAIDEDLWSKLAAMSGTAFFNLYGPTECTVDCVLSPIGSGVDRPRLGRPTANTRLYVLDAALQPLPMGMAGELYIGGAGVARGYLNRPELTAERFLSDPFRPGGRIYRTGDQVRWCPDGTVEYLGRLDSQVKVRGYRIEPGEVQAALLECPGVREAAVIAREDEPGDRRLVAYVVLTPGDATTLATLRAALRERLPHYMVPSGWVELEALPLMPSGKLDRRSLPRPEGRQATDTDFVAPRTQLETILAGVWAEVLRVERVGVHDNFFDLGGDSIISIRVVSRARAAKVDITVRQIFENPTVAELARVATSTSAHLPRGEQEAVVGPVPLTPIQRWFFDLDLGRREHFNQSMLLRLDGVVDHRALESALAALTVHHDALRLCFAQDAEGRWHQESATPGTPVRLERHSLHGLSAAEQDHQLERLANALQGSMSLNEGLLFRAALYELGEERGSRLLLLVHHLAVDAVSWRILLEDLQRAYEQAVVGTPTDLGAKTSSYRQWARRLERYAESMELQFEWQYWLQAASPRACPARIAEDRPGGRNSRASVATVTVGLDEVETRALLRDVPGVYHTQVNDVLLAALVEALTRCGGGEGVHLALEGHGREEHIVGDVDLTRTVGWFTALYPVWLRGTVEDDPGRLLKSVKEQLRSLPGKGLGYGVLRYMSGAIEGAPAPQLSFNYVGHLDEMLSGPSMFRRADQASGCESSDSGTRVHQLEINASVLDDRLQLSWSYSSELHDEATVAHVASEYVDALRRLIAHCLAADADGWTPSDFPLAELTQEQLDALTQTVAVTLTEDLV